MTDAQRLAAPSYEQMQSGVSIGAAGAAFGESQSVPAGHETALWKAPTDGGGTIRSLGVVRGGSVAGGRFDLGATAARSARRPTVAVPTVAVAPVQYHLVAGHSVPTHVRRPRSVTGARS